MHVLETFDAIASRQHGVAGMRQLLDAGLTRAEVNRAVGYGALVPVADGVYRGLGVGTTFEVELSAALITNGRFAVASHRSAAYLWGFDWGEAPVVEITVIRTASSRTTAVVVHRPRQIDPNVIWEARGFPATSPLKTLVDLAEVVEVDLLPRVVESALLTRRMSVELIRRTCERLDNPKWKGPKRLLNVIDARVLGSQLPDSRPEVLFAELCERYAVPQPVFQLRIRMPDGSTRRIDFAYPDPKLAIEVDGWASHLDWSRFQDDRVRQNELALLGWQFLRFTWDQIVNRPDWVAATVLAALERLG